MRHIWCYCLDVFWEASACFIFVPRSMKICTGLDTFPSSPRGNPIALPPKHNFSSTGSGNPQIENSLAGK